jgi:hypothetical protein
MSFHPRIIIIARRVKKYKSEITYTNTIPNTKNYTPYNGIAHTNYKEIKKKLVKTSTSTFQAYNSMPIVGWLKRGVGSQALTCNFSVELRRLSDGAERVKVRVARCSWPAILDV